MKKILLLALLIGVSATVVVAGVNSAITNKDNLAQAQRTKPGSERIPVKLKAIQNNPCPPNMGVPGGQAVAQGGTYTPEELAKLQADAAARRAAMNKTVATPGGQAVAHGGTYTPEEMVDFNKQFNGIKAANASPTPPCPRPTTPARQQTHPMMKLIKRMMGTVPPKQEVSLPQNKTGEPEGYPSPVQPTNPTSPDNN